MGGARMAHLLGAFKAEIGAAEHQQRRDRLRRAPVERQQAGQQEQ